MPIASTVVSRGTSASGNAIRKTGISMAAPLIPESIATAAMMMQTGNMNQYTVQFTAQPFVPPTSAVLGVTAYRLAGRQHGGCFVAPVGP
ncbi:hypothetical protein BH20ACT6_BH20ACT6_20690 [soil metagenome]